MTAKTTKRAKAPATVSPPYKIELRSVHHSERMSEETNCYDAKVFVNGVHCFDVCNRGHGGCDDVREVGPLTLKALDAWIGENHPPAFVIDGKPHKADLETVCGDLLAAWLYSRDLTKALKRKVLFIKPGEPAIYESSIANLALVKSRHPTYKVLNDLPFAEALELYKANAQ